MRTRTRFDERYYRRFYEDPATRAVEPEDIRKLAAHVAAYMSYLGIPLRNALDMGCGIGLWKKALKRLCPGAEYTGVETTARLCRLYGWKRGSVTDFKSRAGYDLVICRSVFQYLTARQVREGLKNLARLCRGAAYIEVVSREDWERNCDRSATDGRIHLRKAAWYRKEIGRHFVNCGGGVFVPRDAGVVLYELEKAD